MSDAARQFHEYLREQQRKAGRAALATWQSIDPSEDYVLAYQLRAPALEQKLLPIRRDVAAMAAITPPATIVEAGGQLTGDDLIDTDAFTRYGGNGRSFVKNGEVPAWRAKQMVASGMTETEAITHASRLATFMTQTMIADVARDVLQVGVALRPRVVWVRKVAPGSCKDCIILAGKTYRFNQGFLRHPNCTCIHVAVPIDRVPDDLESNPYKLFNDLSKEDQDRIFGEADAEAIRLGGDIYQVVNARRGMSRGGRYTSEGTSKRGAWKGDRRYGRLTPQEILRIAGNNREKAIFMLRQGGYILPAGQVPGGSIRGRSFGWGQMGKGGKNAGARQAITKFDETGRRNPELLYTMTAAERRVADAKFQARMARAGYDPFTPRALELRHPGAPKIAGGSLKRISPQRAAQIEQNAQLWISANGDAVIYRRLRARARRMRRK